MGTATKIIQHEDLIVVDGLQGIVVVHPTEQTILEYEEMRYRYEQFKAEIVRDTVLQAAGVLSLKAGGPPVRPPQPDGVMEAAWGRPKWQTSQGDDRYRRSVYTFQKRTAPFAMFNTFDAPSGEACVARRNASNTALQALTLLNDVMFTEAAQAMGKMLTDLDGNDADRIRYGFRRMLTRNPTAEELDQLATFVAKQRKRLMNDEIDAEKIAGSNGINLTEQAVWVTLARALFSLDESVTRN